jgi:RNA polymerase sigma-70 factor, ECF subfamily
MVESALDGELVRCIALRERAHEAEAELCRRFAPRVRLYGLRHLRTEDRAADLVQSVLLAVLEAARAGRIAEPEHVGRFVLGTCRNVA